MAKLTMVDLRILELLTARLCHELSGPIAAVANGVELLAESDADFSVEALALVADSARRAANRLQFYRFAYGFGGDIAVAGPSPYELATKFFEGLPIACHYSESVRALPLYRQKLACNMLLVGAEAFVRVGRLTLCATCAGVQLDAIGEAVSLAPEQAAALQLALPIDSLTTRTVNAYFAGLVARAGGWHIAAAPAGPGRIRIYSTEAPD